MGFREFRDAKGVTWKVWDVTPDQRIFIKRRTPAHGTASRSSAETLLAGDVTPTRERGWLAFQSEQENRRLSPIPPDWENASDAEMRTFLGQAAEVKNRYKA